MNWNVTTPVQNDVIGKHELYYLLLDKKLSLGGSPASEDFNGSGGSLICGSWIY